MVLDLLYALDRSGFIVGHEMSIQGLPRTVDRHRSNATEARVPAQSETKLSTLGEITMTPKERRDAQMELRDWADDLQFRDLKDEHDTEARRQRWNRAALLRAVADELDRVPSDQ